MILESAGNGSTTEGGSAREGEAPSEINRANAIRSL